LRQAHDFTFERYDPTVPTPKLLILDLDETHIFATKEPLDRPADFQNSDFVVYRRPHLGSFLHFCLQNFRVAIWTSSSRAYANFIVANLFEDLSRLDFVWSAERCTTYFDRDRDERVELKVLAKLRRRGYRLEEVLVVDDSPEKHWRNYGNLIRVAPFEGDSTDDELVELKSYLESLRHVPNVRAVEKRGWRGQVFEASVRKGLDEIVQAPTIL
jgi:TFIIF-interacting CTD phosphatase-like protein